MVKLIAIDMDGTLLKRDHSISTENKQAIQTAMANGIEVVIATGRNFPEAYQVVSNAGLDLAMICLNGAEVRDESANIISATHISEKDIQDIIPIFETNDLHYELFIDEFIYTKNLAKQIEMFITVSGVTNMASAEADKIRKEINSRVMDGFIKQVPSYDEVFQQRNGEIYKVLGVSTDQIKLNNVKDMLKDFPGLAISSSGPVNIEINSVNAQKGVALEQYATNKGISMKEVMVIGDNFNDLSMMKRAGRSVAMGNAPDEIKAYCSHVTKTNEENGVAIAIEDVLQSLRI